MRAILIIALFGLLSAAEESPFSYNGYHLLRLKPITDKHIELLDSWEQTSEFDIWNRKSRAIHDLVDVVLSPEAFKTYAPKFDEHALPYSVVDTDIQSKINEQLESMKQHEESKAHVKNYTRIVGTYARHAAISTYLDGIVQDNQDIASTYIAGTTLENRQMKVLVLKTPSSNKLVWLDCGIHAREWVSPATCIWIIDKLISEYRAADPVSVGFLNSYEWHILPVMNPDGYEYTHTNVRLWRKNRRNMGGCFGVDLNRNWGYQWMVAGASNNPCSDIYAGPSPDSELETKAVQKIIMDRQGQWETFITLHSYAQMWFTPWGYSTVLPADYNEMAAIAAVGVAALRSHAGINYVIGTPARLLNPGAGGSFDWTKGVAGIKYSYCLELSPGQTGMDSQFGFTLPVDRVPRVGNEVWLGLKAMIARIKEITGN